VVLCYGSRSKLIQDSLVRMQRLSLLEDVKNFTGLLLLFPQWKRNCFLAWEFYYCCYCYLRKERNDSLKIRKVDYIAILIINELIGKISGTQIVKKCLKTLCNVMSEFIHLYFPLQFTCTRNWVICSLNVHGMDFAGCTSCYHLIHYFVFPIFLIFSVNWSDQIQIQRTISQVMLYFCQEAHNVQSFLFLWCLKPLIFA